MTEDTPSHILNSWLAAERSSSELSYHIKRALVLLESKFSYARWEGLVKLLGESGRLFVFPP
jgi:hypothetical protein